MSAIHDSSGNFLIGSDSNSIFIGDPSGLTNVVIPSLTVNDSDIITDISLGNQFYWDMGLLNIDSSVSDSGISDASLGDQFYWDQGLLYVDSSTASGVSQEYVDASLNAKANIIYVDASLNVKSDLSYVDVSLNSKSDLSYVDASLNSKSDLSYVDASLNAKADLSYVDASLSSIIEMGTPIDSSAVGIMGQIQYDASYLYLCTSTNTWLRFLGETF